MKVFTLLLGSALSATYSDYAENKVACIKNGYLWCDYECMDSCSSKDNSNQYIYELPREPKCPPIAVMALHQDTFKSYYYSLDKGEVCAFPVKNVGSSKKAMYKIFDSDTNLEFYTMETFSPESEDALTSI
jgi:hypothetical protein